MLQVLLVDDDLPMLSTLKSMVEWHAGFVLCGEATGGSAAARLATERKPDIVITDMSMPGMDGLQLIDFIQQHLPETKIIAISGYSDVHYIRHSMKKGAVDYILKHELNRDMLMQTMKAAARQLSKEREELEKSRDLHRQLELSQSFLRRSAVRKLLQGDFDDEEEMLAGLQRLGIHLHTGSLTVVVVEWDEYKQLKESREAKELEHLSESFMDIAEHIVADADKACLTQLDDGKFAILFSLSTSSRLLWHSVIFEALTRIKVSVKRQLNLSVSCSVSQPRSAVGLLADALTEAIQALNERFYEGNDIIIWPDAPKKEHTNAIVTVDVKLEKAILSYVSVLDEEAVRRELSGIFQRMAEARAAYKTAQMVCVELIHLVNKKIKEAGISEQAVFPSGDNPYQTLLQFDTITALGEWVTGVYGRLLASLRSVQLSDHYSEHVRRTMEWIRSHYAEPITLQQAADEIGVNASYLSRLFKEEAGQGFTDYVNQIRVERAKLWITSGDTDLKEIVKKAGFNSYNYFFTVFKKMTGLTPLEFEKKQRE